MIKVDDLTLTPATRVVERAGLPIALTATEFRLLEFLMRRNGRAASRSAIIEGVWGGESDVESNTVDAYVKLLRDKIDSGDRPRLIHTDAALRRGTGEARLLPIGFERSGLDRIDGHVVAREEPRRRSHKRSQPGARARRLAEAGDRRPNTVRASRVLNNSAASRDAPHTRPRGVVPAMRNLGPLR